MQVLTGIYIIMDKECHFTYARSYFTEEDGYFTDENYQVDRAGIYRITENGLMMDENLDFENYNYIIILNQDSADTLLYGIEIGVELSRVSNAKRTLIN